MLFRYFCSIKTKNLFRIISLIIILLHTSIPKLSAQLINQYSFSQSTSTYTSITGTTIIGTSLDDAVSSVTNIGFNFVYHGVTYTQFSASSNGFIVLGSTAPSSSQYSPVSSLANCISFLGRDGKTNGAVKSKTTGTAPNRVLTVQFPNWYLSYSSTSDNINAQIKLYETTNVIEIIYGSSAKANSYTGQVGITGGSASDFSNRTTTTNWAATSVGASNSETCAWSSTVFPTSGLTFRWTPPPACTGTPNPGVASISMASGCINSSFVLSATSLSGYAGVQYQWQISPNGTSGWSNVSGAVDPVLTTATATNSYYRMMSTCSFSGQANYSNTVSFTIENCVPTASNNSYTVCGSSLFDGGGSLLDYSNSIDGYTVLYPSVAGSAVKIEGSYSTEINYDYVYVYNGVGVGGTLLGQYSGTGTIPTFISTDPSGALTVRFSSDGSVVYYGFDFSVNCVTPCSGTPNPGNSLSSLVEVCLGDNFVLSFQNPLLYSGISYQWQSSADNVTYSNISGANAATFNTTQTAAYYYRCLVSCSNSGLSAFSNPVFVSMSSICYCQPITTYVNNIDIVTKVVLTNSISANFTQNSSSNNTSNYDLYSNTPLEIQRGSTTNTLAITFGTDGTQWSAAWIDFNHNGTFEASENIALAATSAAGSSTVSYTFSVPVSATLGNTRMRVRGASDNAYTNADACATTAYGETEDYIVRIIPIYSLSISGPTSSCSYTDVQYVVGINNFPSTPSFQWYYNANVMGSSGSGNAPFYTSYSGGQSETLNVNTFGGTYGPVNWSCVATYNGWSATSNVIALNVDGMPSNAPTSISITNNNTCNTTSKTLSVIGGSLGTGASWNWYSGSCGGTFVGSGTSVSVNPSNNTTYYVRAIGTCNNSPCASTLVTVLVAPVNDLCANATPIPSLPYSSGVQTNNCATNDAPPVGTSLCGVHDYNVWYKFTGNGNQINISTCDASTTFDTEIHVYTGSCGSMTEVICSDEGIEVGCTAGRSSLTMCTLNATTYYISVGSYQNGGATGDFVLTITDKIIGAATVTSNSVCGDGVVTLTANVGANADVVDFSINGGSTVALTDVSSLYQYTTAMLTAPQSVTVFVRSKNSANGCVGSWTNSASASALSNPVLIAQPLCAYEGMCRVELLASGGSNSYVQYEQISPSVTQVSNRFSLPFTATRNYRVKDSQGCYSSYVAFTSSDTPSQIAGASSSGTCLTRNDNSWWHITDPSNNVILSINDNNNNLGNITAWSYLEPSTTYYGDSYYLKRHFKVVSENAPTTNVTLRLYFTDSELSELVTNSKFNANSADDVNGLSDLKITRYSGLNEDNNFSNNDFSCPSCFSVFTPSTGTPVTPNLGASVKYVEISVPGFSEQWIHGGVNNTSVLPVELVSFIPSCNGSDVLIRWFTASELNNSHFILERSQNGFDYTEISRIDGSGNSVDLIEYSYVDKFNAISPTYYRLKQVDFNGISKVFAPKMVQCAQDSKEILIQPNPFKESIEISGLNEGLSLIEVYNSFGQLVYKISKFVLTQESIDLNYLPSGFYSLKITNDNGAYYQCKIVKE